MSTFYAQYPSSSGGSNPSIGTNGVTAPTSSTEVGGINPGGNLSPLQTNAAGSLITTPDPTGVQHVIVDSSALPTGAATAAAQASQLSQETASAASLVSIDGKQSNISTNTGNTAINTNNTSVSTAATAVSVASIDTKTPAVGQAAMAASTPVVIASNQSAVPVSLASAPLPTGAATSALQTSTQGTVAAGTAATASTLTGGVYNTALPTLTTGQQTATQLDSSGRQIISPLTNTSIVKAQLQDNAGAAVVLGQQAATASIPVTLSNENVQDLYFTGQAAQTSTVNNIIPASAGATATDATGYRSGAVQLVCPAGTYTTGAVIFEGSNDNVNFQTIPVWSQLILTGTPIVAAITLATTTSLIYTFPIQTRYIRVRISTGITGASAQVQAFTKLSQAAWSPGIRQIAQSTAANLNATVTATNLSSNIAQINAVTPLMGNGVTGTGSLRVTLASDTSTNTNPLLTNQKGLAFSNAPISLTYSVGSPVTTAAYTQLIASTTSAATWVDIFDSSGQGMILATGAAASEVPIAYIPPGGDSFSYAIPASTRISIKALSANATSGYILLNLRG